MNEGFGGRRECSGRRWEMNKRRDCQGRMERFTLFEEEESVVEMITA